MKAELKQKWIEALRSGEYRQGKGVLRDSVDRFCCLGVLCDVVSKSGWGAAHDVDTSVAGHDAEISAHPYDDGESVNSVSLPHSLRERVGLHIADASALIAMNDSGQDFETIAKHIEANVPAESDSTGAT
jgi:hypothetical protein